MKLSYKRGFEPAHAVRRIVARMSWRARAASVAIVAAALGIGGLSLAAGAGATTLTCTNIAGATTGVLGCGGLQTATGYKFGNLDIAPDGNYFNAVVRVQPDSQANQSEDWTAYAVNGVTSGSYGDLGRYVAMFTPFGNFQYSLVSPAGPYLTGHPAPGTTFYAGPGTYCLSIQSENNGPNHAARWNAVLRNCNSNGSFKYGNGVAPGSVTAGLANAYQVWSPINGEFGLEMANDWATSHHHNILYTLNITGASGAGTHLIAYPETSPAPNESWDLIGCTPPATLLGTPYQFCP